MLLDEKTKIYYPGSKSPCDTREVFYNEETCQLHYPHDIIKQGTLMEFYPVSVLGDNLEPIDVLMSRLDYVTKHLFNASLIVEEPDLYGRMNMAKLTVAIPEYSGFASVPKLYLREYCEIITGMDTGEWDRFCQCEHGGIY